MFLRPLALLVTAIGLSVAATLYFGHEVLIALGLILTQIKVIWKKLAMVELPLILAWLKTHASAFFQFELIKKWLTTTLLPLLLGKAALRRMAAWIGEYRAMISKRYLRLMRWYRGLHPAEKVIAALAILLTTLALSVTSLGLWLILFSVKLPLWFAAAAAAFWRMIWVSVQKMAFKAVAFFQLSWAWRLLRRVLPASWLERKRRFDYRVARAVVRRRRMTIRQLSERKDSLPFRLGILVDYWRGGTS
ncbi:hypothetical protein [Silicimonas sp. MF1-12-2]|uniref:hypothetical protein n=1 Tax=Silicimonas sp. MF1-12-2 TaxID=3384793 RepID=UPI0039B6B2D8